MFSEILQLKQLILMLKHYYQLINLFSIHHTKQKLTSTLGKTGFTRSMIFAQELHLGNRLHEGFSSLLLVVILHPHFSTYEKSTWQNVWCRNAYITETSTKLSWKPRKVKEMRCKCVKKEVSCLPFWKLDSVYTYAEGYLESSRTSKMELFLLEQ